MSTKKKSSAEGYAIASIVVGSLSLLMFWLPYIGLVFASLAFVLALVALFVAFQTKQQSILVFIAIGLSILVVGLSGNVTLKTNEAISNLVDDTKFIFKHNSNINTKITKDSNKLHIIIDNNQNIDSINVEFENLEEIMDSFDDSTSTNIHINIK